MNAANDSGAKNFESGGESRFEILQMSANDGIAYWAGIQWATARMKGKPEAIPVNLRVTEVFRREADDWKLVHRHADPLPPAPRRGEGLTVSLGQPRIEISRLPARRTPRRQLDTPRQPHDCRRIASSRHADQHHECSRDGTGSAGQEPLASGW